MSSRFDIPSSSSSTLHVDTLAADHVRRNSFNIAEDDDHEPQTPADDGEDEPKDGGNVCRSGKTIEEERIERVENGISASSASAAAAAALALSNPVREAVEKFHKLVKSYAVIDRSVGVPFNGFRRRFGELIEFDSRNMSSHTAALRPYLSPIFNEKNRYSDVLPYPETIVSVRGGNPTDVRSYINASWVWGKALKIPTDYIATQGPLEKTTVDFWQMVLDHNVRVIVMLTNLVESNRVKCHGYWPTPETAVTKLPDGIQVECVSQERNVNGAEGVVLTTLRVSKGGQTQEVYHVHFQGWPDHGTPQEVAGFLSLVSFVDQLRRTTARDVASPEMSPYPPVVVHCSAGIGRTGTFITVDAILQLVKRAAERNEAPEISVEDTVRVLREHRAGMVQTLAQFEFCYHALAEALSLS